MEQLGEDVDGVRDYLQDPSLWNDSLPQPFRWLNQLVADLLEDVWNGVERSEARREAKEDRPVIPSLLAQLESAQVVDGVSCLCTAAGDDGGNVFLVCNGTELRAMSLESAVPREEVMPRSTRTASSRSGRMSVVARCQVMKDHGAVEKLSVGCCSGGEQVVIVAVLSCKNEL